MNIELFNHYAGIILLDLYESFPVPLTVRSEKYVESGPAALRLPPVPSRGEDDIDAEVANSGPFREYRIFGATMAFLNAEGLVRWVYPSSSLHPKDLAPEDKLLQNALAKGSRSALQFVLTSHGLAQLSKRFKDGGIINDTMYSKLKSAFLPKMGEEAIGAAGSAAITGIAPIIGSILSST